MVGMSKTPHDNPDQLARIQLVLLPGELILAVYDGSGGSTGMVGLTDRRVIVQDNTFVGGKSGITSLPYSRIQSVSFILDRATALRRRRARSSRSRCPARPSRSSSGVRSRRGTRMTSC